jgi:hypothetical protein
MAEAQQDIFRHKGALLAAEDPLLQQAQQLYRHGFHPPAPRRAGISAAQMAAIEEKIQRAKTATKASGEIRKFLKNQLQKLEARQERTGKAESWLRLSLIEKEKPLGDVMIDWIGKRCADTLPEPERLPQLRRFWTYFHGLYRYERVCGSQMKLPDAIKVSDKGVET